MQEASRTAYLAAGGTPPAELAHTTARYEKEQEDIKRTAEEKERARDERSGEADRLLRRHHLFANAVALLQVGIALGAVAALTQTRLVWLGSIVAGVIAIALFVSQLV